MEAIPRLSVVVFVGLVIYPSMLPFYPATRGPNFCVNFCFETSRINTGDSVTSPL